MTGIFKANNPLNTFLLLLYGLLLKLPVFLHPIVPKSQESDGFLYKRLLNWMYFFNNGVSIVYSLITFALLYIQAISFSKLCNEQKLLQKQTYLPGMSYLLISSFFIEWNVLSSALIVNTILIWVWAQMSKLYNKQNAKIVLFNIGMAIGIATFFYFPSLLFIILIIFGLTFTRSFNIVECLVALLGVITPYYFYLSIIFLTGQWKNYAFPKFVINYPRFDHSNWRYTAIAIVVLISTAGLFFIRQNFKRQLIQTRKSWNLIFLYLIVAVFVPFVNANATFQYWILCAIPVAALASSTFFYTKKWVALSLHWLIVAFIMFINYYLK